jgi:ribosomal protein S18 acetylase RimI-like enzyme
MDIALLPHARGAGVGTHLLNRVMADARGRGAAVSIHVEQLNPARKLYERLGFHQVSEAGAHVLMRWEP